MNFRNFAAIVLGFLPVLAWAANQTVDFSGLVIPNGFASTVDWDGYRVTISGGFQPYMQNVPLRFGTVSPGDM